MPLKLTITSYQRLSPGQEPTKILERGSISIGRAPKNDWVLQDPERILSSEHCIVHYKDGDYILTDTSTNGTFLNDSEERIARNQAVRLKDGDHFILGEYEIAVATTYAETEEEDEGPITDVALQAGLTPPLSAPSVPEASPITSSADIVKPAFDDLLADSRDDQDHLGLEHSAAGSPPPGVATEPPDHIGGPEGAIYEPPELLNPESPAGHQDLPPEPPEPPSPVADAGPLIPDDWWQLGVTAPAPPAPPAAEPLFSPPLPAPPLPAPALPSAPKPAAVAKPPASLSAAPDIAAEPIKSAAQDLLQTFLDSAGLPHLRLTDGQRLEIMANLGAIFRETVRGLMDILLARGDIKGEFRLSRTAIGPIENNPLKTPPGQPPLRIEEVMALMLIGQKGAYMSPVQAVQEGFNDIKAHQLAVMAGIQAALSRLIDRFDPGNLETRLEQSVLDNLWPANRKAKYWDLFNAEYQAIAREAEDDFNELFGDEFARAYEERLRSR